VLLYIYILYTYVSTSYVFNQIKMKISYLPTNVNRPALGSRGVVNKKQLGGGVGFKSTTPYAGTRLLLPGTRLLLPCSIFFTINKDSLLSVGTYDGSQLSTVTRTDSGAPLIHYTINFSINIFGFAH
jgi:hypothetical protein